MNKVKREDHIILYKRRPNEVNRLMILVDCLICESRYFCHNFNYVYKVINLICIDNV